MREAPGGTDAPGTGRSRIALVVEELRESGGQERTALEIARRLSQRFEIHVVTAVSATGRDEEPFSIHVVPRASWPEALRFRSFVREAGRALARIRPDRVHGIGANCPGAHIVHLQTVNREKYARLPELVPAGLARRLAFRWYLREVLRAEAAALTAREALFVAVSRSVGEEARRHYGVPAGRIRTIPNGVDREHYRPPTSAERAQARRALALPSERTVLAFVGPDHRRKGLPAALAALARPELSGCLLVSVGGDLRSIEEHRREAARSGLGSRVRFLPHGDRVREVLWAADAFLFPTLYEPFGMAAAEALCCAVPVVLSREAGVAEWLGPGDAVFLEQPGDEREIARRTGELLGSPEGCRRVGEAGARRGELFDWDRVAAQNAAVWTESLATELSQTTSITSP